MQKLRKTLFLFALFHLFTMREDVHAVSMHCTAVDATGGVTVTWDAVNVSNVNFRSWYLYHSTSAGGPYSLADSLLIFNPTSDYDAAANAIINPGYYFVVFKSNNGSPDVFSDTIRTIGLNLNNPASGFANLTWNATHNPLIGTNNSYYLIYREYPAGTIILIDSVDARTAPVPMSYSDLINICDDTIRYHIEVRDSSGCISISSVKKDRFQDVVAPIIPQLDSVSVDLAGNATVTWLASPSTDANAYVVLQNPGPVSVDTVYGINTTTLNTTISATNNSQTFGVIAVDSCNNPSSPSSFHSTIFLRASYDRCSLSANLSWTPYNFWGTPPSYDILVSVNGAPETIAGTTMQTSFGDTNLISGANFCYRVRAREIGTSRSSTSNKVCLIPNFPPPPAFSYIRKVTVVATDEVYIEAYVDPAANVSGYRLLRSVSPTGPFSTVGSLGISGVSSISFTDNIPTDRGPYYYLITTLDSCGRSVLASQVSNTILLTGVANPDYTNSISWTNYSSWPAGVDRYNIYLSSNGSTGSNPFITLSALDLAYIDSVMDDFYSDGKFCYVVEAVEAPGNPNLFLDSSRSNEVCLVHQPLIFIPSAFHPGGLFNEFFLPSNSFVPAKEYSLDIYNRWGENIFHTNDPLVGWNGASNGKFSQEGVYIYRLKTKKPDGTDLERVGSVTLIR